MRCVSWSMQLHLTLRTQILPSGLEEGENMVVLVAREQPDCSRRMRMQGFFDLQDTLKGTSDRIQR
jgi:hypothetical protein